MGGIIFLSIITSIVLLVCSRPCWVKWGRKRNDDHQVVVFIFGDSIFDAGTNDYINSSIKANVVPYGETFFPYPTGRFSNGRLIPDFIGLPLIPPYLQPNFTFDGGANFASAGSGALVGTNTPNVIDLKTQVEQFEELRVVLKKELGDEEANRTISNAVYLLCVGGDDLISQYTSSSSTDNYDNIVDMVIGNVTSVVQSIYSVGGRKFGFVNVMPIGCIPNRRATTSNGTCVHGLNLMATIYNLNFQKALEKLQLPDGFKYSIFNFYDTLLQRINYPSAYGLEEAKKACCGSGEYNGVFNCGSERDGEKKYNLCRDPSKYAFFDSYHPTQNVYRQLAYLAWNGGHHVIRPYNFRALFTQPYN